MRSCIEYIEESRSYTIVVTNIPELYKKYTKDYTGYHYIRFALGLHPKLVSQYNQLSLFHKEVKASRYIGEVGLDFTSGIDRKQIEVFKEIVKSCQQYNGKIISVHSRRAANEVMNIIGNSNGNGIILHWFSGSMKELERAINMGFYFSINTNMLTSKRGVEIVKSIPSDKLLIESDAPFTNATKNSYELSFINIIVAKTAEVLNKPAQEIRKIYSENFVRLLNLYNVF
jgi:TatD DNase family protein